MAQKFIAREKYEFPNGAIGWRPGGPFDCLGPYAKVQNCPVIVNGQTVARVTAYATGVADTFFSVPACTRIGGKHIGGYFTGECEFHVYDRFADRALAAIQRAARPRFNYESMRERFYEWHGGMSSPLYAAASTGLVSDADALRAEIYRNVQWCEANPRAQSGTADDARYFRRVADALENILGSPRRCNYDGRIYRPMPWANLKVLQTIVE